MRDVFITYGSQDEGKARRLAAALESRGWTAFWDRTIPPGKSWEEIIGTELANCPCHLVLWSQDSISSIWVVEEARRGLKRGVLIPAFIDDVAPPKGFGGVRSAGMIQWEGSELASKCGLVARISELLGPPPAPAARQATSSEDIGVDLDFALPAREPIAPPTPAPPPASEAAKAPPPAAGQATGSEEIEADLDFDLLLPAPEPIAPPTPAPPPASEAAKAPPLDRALPARKPTSALQSTGSEDTGPDLAQPIPAPKPIAPPTPAAPPESEAVKAPPPPAARHEEIEADLDLPAEKPSAPPKPAPPPTSEAAKAPPPPAAHQSTDSEKTGAKLDRALPARKPIAPTPTQSPRATVAARTRPAVEARQSASSEAARSGLDQASSKPVPAPERALAAAAAVPTSPPAGERKLRATAAPTATPKTAPERPARPAAPAADAKPQSAPAAAATPPAARQKMRPGARSVPRPKQPQEPAPAPIAKAAPPRSPAKPATSGPRRGAPPKGGATTPAPKAPLRLGPFQRYQPKQPVKMPQLVTVPAGTLRVTRRISGKSSTATLKVRSFDIGRYPVTFDEYDRYAQDSGQPSPHDQGWGRGRRPVINVRWEQAIAYARWLSDRSGQAFRLPTRDEWQYVIGISDGIFEWSGSSRESDLDEDEWYWPKYGVMSHPVNALGPNDLGIYDLQGNVWEWVQPDADGAADGSAPESPICLSADKRLDFIGFRIARDLG